MSNLNRKSPSRNIWKRVLEIGVMVLWYIFFGILLITTDPHDPYFALGLFFLLAPIFATIFAKGEPDPISGYGDPPEHIVPTVLWARGLAVVLWLIIRWML